LFLPQQQQDNSNSHKDLDGPELLESHDKHVTVLLSKIMVSTSINFIFKKL
jgi:hypothetical protein